MSPRTVDPAREQVASAVAPIDCLPALAALASGCVACPELARTRQRVVAGEFPPGARLMLVGEAPGAQEDETGRPFVGKGGRLLDALLAAAGLERAQIAVANILKCRPPGNRTPTRAEAARCTAYLDRQVELAEPSLVVTLGMTALTWALGTGHRLGDVHGQVLPWRGRRVLATYHPSAALRFGPNGAPMAALAADLKVAAASLGARS